MKFPSIQYSKYILSLLLIYLILTRVLFVKALQYATFNDIDKSDAISITFPQTFNFKTEFDNDTAKICLYWINKTYENTCHPGECIMLFDINDNVYGGVYVYQSIYWVVFRGTIDFSDVLEDVKMNQTSISWETIGNVPNPLVHKGFKEIYSNLRDKITEWFINRRQKDFPVVLTGHSLGACINMLMLSDKAIQDTLDTESCVCYTFGCPRVGNSDFVQILQDNNKIPCFRVGNEEDIIITRPQPISVRIFSPSNPYFYQHYGTPKYFSIQKYSYYKNHSIYTYVLHFTLI